MTEHERILLDALPLSCAVLHAFDPEALCALADIDIGRARALCTSPIVGELALSDHYHFQPHIQSQLLARLRRERPRDELALHQRAFSYYLDRLQSTPAEQRHPAHEVACFHHLRMLRELNLDYMRWEEGDTQIEAVRTVGPFRQELEDELTLFTAYNATRLQQYDRSDALLHALLGRPDLAPNLRAAALNAHGILYMVQARFEPAIARFEATLHLADAINPSHYGGALINLSWVYNQLRQFNTALELSRRSLDHFRAANDLYGETYALYTIGNNALYLGHWPLALEHLDQASAIYDAAGMAARLAMVDYARGLLYQILGDEAGSERAYLSGLVAAESRDYGNPVTARDTLTQLGLLYQTQERLAEAADAYARASALDEKLRDEHWRALLLHRAGMLQLKQGQIDTAFTTLHQAVETLEELRVATEGEEIKISLLGTIQQVYESTILICLARGDSIAAFGYVERARARAFLDLLARRDAALTANLAQQPVALADVQSRLAPDALLLEYYTIGEQSAGDGFLRRIPATNTRLRDQLIAPPEILLFAISRDHMEVHRINFDPNRLQPLPGDPMPGRHLLTERKLSWLYQLLIHPVEHLIAGRRLLYIIPHGPLHYVPFAALQVPDGTTLLARHGPALAHAPSATVLHTCLDRPIGRGSDTLAIGYNDTGPRTLRFAESEARQIAFLAGGHALDGPEPKGARLLELAPRLRQLHIAGHAVFQPSDPLGSFVRLGVGDQLDARTLIRHLKLSADLVTLNACTSGLSHVVPGDELLGLPRALLFAGAATVLCTLADVDDLAAYLLMVTFYQNLALGNPPAASLHAAQNMLRALSRAEVETIFKIWQADGAIQEIPSLDLYAEQPFAHPRYWAPFMIIGRP